MHTNTENLFGRFYNMKTTLNDDMIGTPAKRSFTFFFSSLHHNHKSKIDINEPFHHLIVYKFIYQSYLNSRFIDLYNNSNIWCLFLHQLKDRIYDELYKKSEIADTIVYYNRLIEQYHLPMTSFKTTFLWYFCKKLFKVTTMALLSLTSKLPQ